MIWLMPNVTSAGESLQDERVHGGAFVAMDGVQMPYKHMPVALPSPQSFNGFIKICGMFITSILFWPCLTISLTSSQRHTAI